MRLSKRFERYRYEKVKILLSALLSAAIIFPLLPANVSAAGEVVINSTNFPDAVFRQYVSDVYDTDGDGKLSSGEANVNSMDVEGKGISDLTGIEYFKHIKDLNCNDNNLRSLDLSACTELTWVVCTNNNLTSLNLSNLTNLKALLCSDNRLSNLDLSELTSLEKLICNNNFFANLDLSNLSNLEMLNCSNNCLTSLDLSSTQEIFYLY